MPKTETSENDSHSFVNRLLITMPFEVAIGAFLATTYKRLCFEKGTNGEMRTPQYSQRIHLKTEQCEQAVLFFNENGSKQKRSSVNLGLV